MKHAIVTVSILATLVATATFAQSRPALRGRWFTNGIVGLYWDPVPGATRYTVYRTTAYPTWQNLSNVSAYSYADPLAANSAVLYKMQPTDNAASPVGPESNPVLITSYPLSDEPIVYLTTRVGPVHITELRTAVNAARAAAGLGSATWTYSNLASNSPIHKEDISDLRTALNAVFTAVQLPTPDYVDPVLTSTTRVKRDHIEQLRQRVRGFPEYFVVTKSVSNRYFSPNNDGSKDDTNFSASASITQTSPTDFRWIVNVRNSGGTLLSSGSGSGPVSYTWNGRDSSNITQPEGDYTFELVDADGISVPLTTDITTIDLTPPAVSISSPTSAQTVSNVRQNGSADVTVTGSTTDAHFQNWSLKDNGATINNGSAPVSPSGTLGIWHTLPTANGAHALSLTATDLAGNANTATANVTVGNFSVVQSDKYQFNLANSSEPPVTYTSTVPFPLNETLTIKSVATGLVVKTLINGPQPSGSNPVNWVGTNDQSQPVPDGAYQYIATATEGTSSMTWDQSSQYLSGAATQYNYADCRKDDGTLAIGCNDASITFDPFNNHPLRINYCVGGQGNFADQHKPGGEPPLCTEAGNRPALVFVKMMSSDPTTPDCSGRDCVWYENQSSGAHEVVTYGPAAYGVPASSVKFVMVIRRFDIWPLNQTLVYGTAPAISNLGITPIVFNPWAPTVRDAPANLGQQIQINVAPFGGRSVSLKAQFRSIVPDSILRTITSALGPGGLRTIYWDGHADNGDWVAPGKYEVIITVTDSVGSTAVIKPLVTVVY
jgi:flagellar hook assembly protein FlgD